MPTFSTGSYNACGGTWNNAAKTFTVAAATGLDAGVSDAVTTGERLLITDLATGQKVGASFGSVTPGTNFEADLLSGSSLSGLPGDQSVLGAWNFTTNFTGGQALLSFDVGAGLSDLSVWRYSGSVWSAFSATDLTYGDDGIANFAVTGFSGYALTVPKHPGDANDDGAVDVVDLGILATNYDATGLPHGNHESWGLADFDDNGIVDVGDLGILATNYDWTGPGGTVPEPGSAALIALGGLALLRRSRRK